ncbi:MAG TPA: UbiD family decarboxylase [Chloroflexota bacterium]|nr:UbiD family decarboxylase [Chloroflexota bacterium]
MAKDLRSFLDELRALGPEELVTIDKPVRPAEFDVTAILEHLTLQKRFPSLLFCCTEDLHGQPSRFPLVTNLFATRARCARAMGLPPEKDKMELSLAYARLEQQRVPAVTIPAGEAPVREVVLSGESADLAILPIVRHFEMDLAPVLTMATIMKDPDEGFYDVTFIKTFYKDQPRRAGLTLHSPHHLRILKKYEERGQPAPVVNVLAHHPAFFLGSLALSPWGTNDYDVIGAFLGEPLRLCPSETWGQDFLVPADSEILIEGVIPPGEKEICDPFGEVTRTYQPQGLKQAYNVTAITHRREAILQDVYSGHEEHWYLGSIPKEGSMFNSLERQHGCVRAVHLPNSGSARFTAYISIKKEREGIAKRVAMSALLESWQFNWIVVVDEDIDVFDEQEVLWALYTYTDPSRDVDVLKNQYNIFHSAARDQKIIIDATRPLDTVFTAKINVPAAAMDRIVLADFGL